MMPPNSEPEINAELWSAIHDRKLVRLRYKDKERVVEPHDYGIHHGVPKLLAFQLVDSSSAKPPNWRWLETDLITDLQVLEQTFPGGRSTPSGSHHSWDRLFIRVEPSAKTRAAKRT
jgi:hypothetical protein